MSDAGLSFSIGSSPRERLVVRPTRHEYPEARDYWDGNWIYSDVEIAARAFQGGFECTLRLEDFVSFRDELRTLHEGDAGSARFGTMEL